MFHVIQGIGPAVSPLHTEEAGLGKQPSCSRMTCTCLLGLRGGC